MENLREELSAAVALTSLCSGEGEPSKSKTQVEEGQNRASSAFRPTLGDFLRFKMMQNQYASSSLPVAPIRAMTTGVVMGDENLNNSTNETSRLNEKMNKKKKNFPQKLFDLLEHGYHSDIVTWLPGGKAFIVIDKRRFANEILPHYFKESQYTSFTRKLSRWKFTRVPRGQYMGAYFHKNFRSDNRTLCNQMSCNDSASKVAKEDVDSNEGKPESTTEATVESLVEASVQEAQVPPPRTTPSSPMQSVTFAASPSASYSVSSKDRINIEKALLLQSSMERTQHRIKLIKEQLQIIRLQKARFEDKKQLLRMQAEASRLKEIQRLRSAVDKSIQEAEMRIILAASKMSNTNNTGSNRSILRNNIQLIPSAIQKVQVQRRMSIVRHNSNESSGIGRAFAA